MYKRYLNLNLGNKQSAFLWGPRKVGKSTYLKSHFADSIYFDLLKTDLYLKYLKQPFLLREEILALDEKCLTKPIIIDEIQKIPALLDEVHWLIENTKSYFILCGSSVRKLKKYGVNLLGGRAIKYVLGPLSFQEIENDFNLLRILNDGLIPSHYQNPMVPKLLKAYVEDYLTQEIQTEALVRNIAAFHKFLDSVAFSNGELVNYSNISRDCSVDAKTIKEYYNILVDTLVGDLVLPFAKKAGREIISSMPKFYFFDVGIANRVSNRIILDLKGAEAGRALEHYVFMELKNFVLLNDLDCQINYWRSKNGFEVDFVLNVKNSYTIPIEVKIASSVQYSELKSLKIFMQEYEIEVGYIVSLEPTVRLVQFETKKIFILPIKVFLQKLWDCDLTSAPSL